MSLWEFAVGRWDLAGSIEEEISCGSRQGCECVGRDYERCEDTRRRKEQTGTRKVQTLRPRSLAWVCDASVAERLGCDAFCCQRMPNVPVRFVYELPNASRDFCCLQQKGGCHKGGVSKFLRRIDLRECDWLAMGPSRTPPRFVLQETLDAQRGHLGCQATSSERTMFGEALTMLKLAKSIALLWNVFRC